MAGASAELTKERSDNSGRGSQSRVQGRLACKVHVVEGGREGWGPRGSSIFLEDVREGVSVPGRDSTFRV